jgi:hypothetical protein
LNSGADPRVPKETVMATQATPSKRPTCGRLSRLAEHLNTGGLPMGINIRDDVLNGLDFFRILVGYFHLVLFFQSHH